MTDSSNRPTGCPLDRRHFLARFGMAGGAMLFSSRAFSHFAPEGLLSPPGVPGDGTVKPRIHVAFSRRLDDYSDWMSSPGAAYDPSASQMAYTEVLEKAAARQGVNLHFRTKPLRDQECVNQFLREVKAKQADSALIVVMQSRSYGWDQVDHFLKARDEDFPAIVYAPRGTYFRTSHLRRYQDTPRFFLGATHDINWLETGLRTLRALWQIEHTNFAVVGGDREYEEKLKPTGLTLRHIPLNSYVEAFRATQGMAEAETIAREYRDKVREIVEPTADDMIESARTYLASRRIMEEYGCHALTLDCLSLVRNPDTPTCPPPCLAFSRLLNERTCGCCERDTSAGLLLLLSSYLLDKPGFMHNATPFTVRNTYGGTHCTAPTLMSGFDGAEDPYQLRSHAESDVGVAPQVMFRENHPGTLMQFIRPGRLRLATGVILKSIVTQPASGGGGCRTGMEMAMDDVDNVLDITEDRHNVLVYGRHLHEIRAWGKLAGVQVEHFTRGVL